MKASAEAIRKQIASNYGAVGPHAEEIFDRLADMAAEIFGAPIALVSLISGDQIWFKSHRGTELESVPLASTLCEQTLQLTDGDEVLVVEDARAEPRFAAGPFVLHEPYIRFFLGAPLIGSDGSVFGVICVADPRPREWPPQPKLDQLRALAKIISGELELRRARVQLAEKERVLDLSERLSGVGHWRFDPASGETEWSDQVYRMLGLTRETFTPAGGRSLTYRDAAERVRMESLVAAAFRSGQGFDTNIHIRRTDGAERELICRADCLFDKAGRSIGLCGVLLDVTERKALEASMMEAREAAEAAAHRAEVAEAVAGLGHWRIDLRTREVTLSAELYRIYGLSQDAPVDLSSLSAMMHPDDRAHALKRLEDVARGLERPATLSRFLRDGEVRYLEGAQRLERDVDGAPVAVVGTLQDVTERQRAEQAIRDSEEQLREMAETVSDLIIHTDGDGALTYVSPSSRRLLGYEPEELAGRTLMSLLHPDDAALLLATIPRQLDAKPQEAKPQEAKPQGCDDSSAPLATEIRMIHKDGREIWFEGRPVVSYDPLTGMSTGATDVLRDITARKALEAQLRAAQVAAEQATAVKSEFLANMSHELRTPLTSIIGFTSLAAEQPGLSPNTRAYVDRVAEASQALLCTVNDILDFSKLEAGQVAVEPQPTSLARLVQATLDLFTPQAGAKDLTLVLETEGDQDVVVRIDPDRTRQILLNLVGNAVKFTKVGGVTVRTRHDPIAGELFVAVVDTGQGIAPDCLDRLFKRFSQVDGSITRSHGGTGLGLAICKGLVEAMGGEIGVESEEGQGSCFWFRIPAPLADLPLPHEEADETADRALLEGIRVLVVDDHPANRELARLFLEGMGAEVAEAEDGEIAVARAEAEAWDIVVMDVRMPRLDGPGALRRIRQGSGPNRDTPILAFTADADVESLQRIEAVGFQGVVAKPVDPSLLILAVARALAT